MLIALSIYKKPLFEVDLYRNEHHQFLRPLFDKGKLLACGRQDPPVGGVIIAKALSLAEFKMVLDDDPFSKAGVAEYKIIKFIPSFYDPLLAAEFHITLPSHR